MEALKALSDLNIKISEARSTLFKIQEDETAYLMRREQAALDRIEEAVTKSRDLINLVDENYAQIQELTNGVTDTIKNLWEYHKELYSYQEDFERRNQEWEKRIGKQLDDIEEQKKNLLIRKAAIENDKKGAEEERKKLVEDQKKLHKDRMSLNNAIIRLKKGKI